MDARPAFLAEHHVAVRPDRVAGDRVDEARLPLEQRDVAARVPEVRTIVVDRVVDVAVEVVETQVSRREVLLRDRLGFLFGRHASPVREVGVRPLPALAGSLDRSEVTEEWVANGVHGVVVLVEDGLEDRVGIPRVALASVETELAN